MLTWHDPAGAVDERRSPAGPGRAAQSTTFLSGSNTDGKRTGGVTWASKSSALSAVVDGVDTEEAHLAAQLLGSADDRYCSSAWHGAHQDPQTLTTVGLPVSPAMCTAGPVAEAGTA